MTNEEYQLLSTEDKKLASEAYIDGYSSAIETVESIVIRIGDERIDTRIELTVNNVLSILRYNLKKMTNEEGCQ